MRHPSGPARSRPAARWRLLSRRLLALLLLAVASCTEGGAPLAPADTDMLRLLLQPDGSSTCAPAQPINRIRLTALAQPSGEAIHRAVFDVAPTATSWTLALDIPLSEGVTRVVVLMELINAGPTGESVLCSGLTPSITLEPGETRETAAVTVYQGSADNLNVTGVAITTAAPEGLVEGETVQLAVQVDGTGNPTTVWSSLDPDVASVSGSGLVQLLRNGSARIQAQAGAHSDIITLVAAQRPTSITIAGPSAPLPSFGDEAAFTATVLDPRGAAIAAAAVEWSVEGNAAEHLGGGRFRAVANGTATIRAAVTGAPTIAQTTALVVRQIPVTLSVDPASFAFSAVGQSATLTAEPRDARGHVVADAQLEWSSSDPSVASVSETGTVTATGRGSATITARSGELTASSAVAVTQVPARIALTPGSLLLESLHAEAQLDAVVLDAGDHPVDDAVVEWSSSDTGVATVSADGTVTAVANGSATITATAGEASASADVTVRQRADRIELAPAEAVARSLGEVVSFGAQVVDAGGSPVADIELAWSSSDEDVAVHTGNGSFRAVSNGTATITVSGGALSATGTLTVRQEAVRVEVTPASFIFTALDLTTDVSAAAFDAGGSVIANAPITWSSSGDAVSISPSGTARAVAAGTVVITATADNGVAGTADFTVRQVIAALELSPSPLRFSQIGASAAVTVVAQDPAGHPIESPQGITWSATGGAASVDENGVVTAEAPGTAVVEAVSGDVRASIDVVVEQRPASIRIQPEALSFSALGESASLDVAVLDAGGAVIPDAAVSLSSTDPAVAEVSLGVVLAVGPGAAAIRATAGDLTAEVPVTVEQLPHQLVVDPVSMELAVGGSGVIEASLVDAGGTVLPEVEYVFSSSDESIAVVDESGTVQGVAAGSAVVWVQAGGLLAEVTVEVTGSGGPGHITGRVLHALTQAPISGAIVSFQLETDEVEGRLLRLNTAAAPSTEVVETDADGRYVSPSLPGGTYRVIVSAEGFISTTLHDVVVAGETVEAQSIPLVPASTQTGAISGRIVNAQTAFGLPGVTVELRSGVGSSSGAPLATTTSNSSGFYRFDDLEAGAYSVRARLPGYVDGSRTGISVGGSEIQNQDISLVAQATTEGEVRIVLSWGADPRDLDSHLTGPLPDSENRFHVYYGNDGSITSSPFAALDVDDTSGHGPETITISQQFAGEYRYSVDHFSGSGTLSTSGAVVQVFRGNALIARFEPPSGAFSGQTWYVFRMNGNTIIPVNTFQSSAAGMSTAPRTKTK